MPLIKTLSQALRMDKERFKVPRSVQQAIPIQRIWPDGIFQQDVQSLFSQRILECFRIFGHCLRIG